MRIIVATHNEGKLVEINRILEDCLGADADQVELVSAGSLNLPDPVEDGVTFQENALLKARDVAARTGCPAIADDSGLAVDALGGAPGIYSARYSGVDASDQQNLEKLLDALKDVPDDQRQAQFHCVLVYLRHAEDPTPLAQQIRNDGRWTPATALALLVFVLLYAPCLVTVAAIRQETGSWGWPVFSMVFNTLIAFGAAVAVRHVTMLFL